MKNAFKQSTVRLIDDNILFIQVHHEEVFALEDYRTLKLDSLRVSSGKPVYNLVYWNADCIPTKEAREACTRDSGRGQLKGEAIIVKTLGQRIMARYIVKQRNKHFPVRVFSHIEPAKKWLNALRNQ